MEPPLHKTPPKSAERIRAVLQSVHEQAGTEAPAGPQRDGMAPDSKLVIASFHDGDNCRRFQEMLLQKGIASQSRIYRTYAEVLVEHSDHQRASELLELHLLAYPDEPPPAFRRDFDCTIFGTVLGATLGLLFLAASIPDLRSLLVCLNFSALGAITGALLDRPRNRYRRSGQLQFGLGDVLVLTAVIALAFALWRLLNGR